MDQVVELRDLLPTFCDLAETAVPDIVDGRSILPLCEDNNLGWREYLHGEHTLGDDSTQWLTDGHMKYIWYPQSGRELLFDLDNDPTELHDLSSSQPGQIAQWRAHLIHELTGREEGFVQDGALVVGRPQSATLEGAGVYAAR